MVAEENVPAIQLGRATQVDGLAQRIASGEPLQSILAGPLPETIVLPVDWQFTGMNASPQAAYIIELSTRGTTPASLFLHVIVETAPNSYALFSLSQQQANTPLGGFAGGLRYINLAPGDWVHWTMRIWDSGVDFRVATHSQLVDPFMGGGALPGIPPPYRVKAIVIGAGDLDALAVAEVRLWDALWDTGLFGRAEDRLEFLGGRRLDGRETTLVGYWKLGEGAGSRAMDSSRFGHDGTLNGGKWLDGSVSGLKLDCTLERLRQQRESLYALARKVRSVKAESAGRTQEIELQRNESRRLHAEQEDVEQQAQASRKGLADEVAVLKREFKEWQKRIEDGGKVGLDDFSESLAKEVDEASAKLIEAKSPYQLQHVALEAKMIPVQKEGKQDFLIAFPQPEDDRVQAGQLSTVNLSFEPRPASPDRSELEVPDVRGYTELVARRLLTKRGFQVDVMDLATDKAEDIDRVIDQEPKGGTETGPDQGLQQPVTLFLGRASGSGGG